MDTLSKAQRSANMANIKGRNTSPELAVRRELHRRGLRFRLHVRDLPGTPDVVLPRHRLIILIHGCFWHRHGSCEFAYTPKTRVDFWNEKFLRTVSRDARTSRQLRRQGWRVSTVWECDTRSEEKLRRRVCAILSRTCGI